MKLLLITSVVCFAAALAAPADKQKSEFLPGDPRYGSDYHHHHHHHDHDREVQISKAAGGYLGSITVPDETEKDSLTSYGQPADKQKREILPGDPRYGTDYHHHHHHHDHDNEVQISKAAGGYVGTVTVPEETEEQSLTTSYGPPNYNPGKPLGIDYTAPSETIKNTAIQVPATSYGIPDIQINNFVDPTEEKSSAVGQTNLNTDYQAPSVEAPITSYVANEEHPQIYGERLKTVYEQPQIESVHVQKAIVPEVHHEVHQPAVHKEIVSQAKTTPHLPVETQGAQHSVSSLPSYTSSINSFPNYFYSSYPSYSSYSNIPVRTLDHRVQVQVPQPYPVPVTKQVSYPVPVPHPVEVPKPYYVRVAQPVQVAVNRPYAVEVPRPVPYPVPVAKHVSYPVPQYVRTNVPVPVLQHQHLTTVDATKASNPIQGFLENSQSSFQNVLNNLPSFPNFPNSFETFQNFFPNFELPNFPGLPSFPQPTQTPAPAINNVNAASTDSVAVDNPIFKTETTVTKTVRPVVTHHAKVQTTPFKPATSCAGCTVITNQKEQVHSIDNGGYY